MDLPHEYRPGVKEALSRWSEEEMEEFMDWARRNTYRVRPGVYSTPWGLSAATPEKTAALREKLMKALNVRAAAAGLPLESSAPNAATAGNSCAGSASGGTTGGGEG